jgi:hypothetical protein
LRLPIQGAERDQIVFDLRESDQHLLPMDCYRLLQCRFGALEVGAVAAAV